jgi:hypothetical protein
MFDVQSFHCSAQAEFHTSDAAGLKSGQFNHQKTVPFWCSSMRELRGTGVSISDLKNIWSLISGQWLKINSIAQSVEASDLNRISDCQRLALCPMRHVFCKIFRNP